MPGWHELAEQLAVDLREYEPQNDVDAISAFQEQYGRPRLVERLRELLHITTARPGRSHEALCRLDLPLVVTTNFDFLLERGYEAVHRPCSPVVVEEQLSQSPHGDQTQLLKLHGDLNHPDELVVTEDDFDGFLQRRPLFSTFAANLLIGYTPVLVGYSFDDPDTRALWSLIQGRLTRLRRRGYALRLRPSPTEIARFDRRGISVVTLPGDDHRQAFAELFEALHDAATERLREYSAPAEDEVAAELVLPASASSRLCFCSVPVRRLPWYRQEIFPIIEDLGYVAVRRDDIIATEATAAAATSAVIARAHSALVDATSFSTNYELNIAVDALPPGSVMALIEPAQDKPANLRPQDPIFVFDDETRSEPKLLVDAVRRWLSDLPRTETRPRALLELGHPEAAIAAAFAGLEVALRQRLESIGTERSPSLLRLVLAATDRGIISSEEAERFRRWVRLRNVAVHTQDPIDQREVEDAVTDVEMLLTRLDTPPTA